ncbi:ricin-type beta-trefoil lectin protein [Paenibacillus taihuensis]|uniref:Ricin-type beta-trefoil lectin protein n=1 Tax=Paenibacillus taihuensis TaxID=1156355 RepID=A0A3D9Q673_9BACL|nr:AbfB domain-containing protein [Paenibacillus taihuensis]REE56488.1 ricin-type beta-trefoil lectin protein [Paenibacillus taihuensis]
MNKRKRFFLVSLALLLLLQLFAIAPANAAATGSVVYSNSAEPEPYYARAVKLGNGNILATFTRKFPVNTGWTGMQPFNFYQSSDNGKSWSYLSQIDPNSFGLSRDQQAMTTLYVLPQQLGSYPAGTLLFASSDWGVSATYTIHIWRSTDNGATWQLHSNLAAQGGSGTHHTWEPEFAVSSDGRLVCYYSDERQAGYNQAIAREISSDGGVTWGNYSIIIGDSANSGARPGMPRVVRHKNGTYYMFYEHFGNPPEAAVRFKTSSDGINWGTPSVLGTVVGTGIYRASQAPEVAYVDDGSANGRFYVRGMTDVVPDHNKMFTSADNGATWQLIDAPLTVVGSNQNTPAAWSGTLLPLANNMLFEINTVKNGSINEIRSNVAQMNGDSSIVSGATYKFVNQNNALVIDNAGGGSPAGTRLIEYNDLGLNTQWFKTDYQSGGFFRVVNVNNNLVWDDPNGVTTPGTQINQWTDNFLDTQRWKFAYSGSGYYTIMNEHSGLMVDNAGGGAPAGTKIIQYTANGLDTQRWKAVRVDTETPITQFETYNFPGSFIRHESGRGKTNGSQYIADAQWKLVPGLADPAAISIESVNFPGHYLRHKNGEVWMDINDGTTLFKNDATWRLRTGFANGFAASFESYNIAGQYMRHMNGLLYISSITTSTDQQDATFFVK